MAKVSVVFRFLVVLLVSVNGFPAAENDDSENSDPSIRILPFSRGVKWDINVELEEPLKPYEQVGISGDVKSLGSWLPNKAVFLNRTESITKWTGSVRVPAKGKVNYRFFIGFVDSAGGVQVRNWETHVDGRTVELEPKGISTTDQYGIVQDQKKVHRGWLNSGKVVQFKLFRNPIQLNDESTDPRVFVKVTPIDLPTDQISVPQQVLIEYTRFQYGNSEMRDQPENGVPYEKDDIVIFHITTSELESTAFKFTLSKEDEEDPEEINVLGSEFVYPEDIESFAGIIDLNIEDIGTIKLRYMLVEPLPTPQLYFKNTFVTFWRNNWRVQDVAHRGIRNNQNIAPLTENTIAAMRKADAEGADMIETDVQLSKDRRPLIYHNFNVYTPMNASTTPQTKDDLKEILIKDLDYEELMSLDTYEIINSQLRHYQPQNTEPRIELRKFPLFEDLMNEVNHTIGYDIEIKWPQALYSGEYESTQTMDKNMYIDKILDVMLRLGCGRLTFITSVDADVCTMVQLKQNMYPVMFTGPSSVNFYEDPRSDSLEQNINNAQAMEFLGVVPHTYNFLKDGSRVKLATDLDLKIFIYGDDGNSTKMVKYFKGLKPTGVIYPRVDLWIQDEEENVYERDPDLPEYFDRQCLYGNSTVSI